MFNGGDDMTTRKTHRVFGATAISALALVAATGGAFAQDTFRIGGINSYSGGGASLGTSFEIGWQMALDAVNAEGGILGRQAVIVSADTQSDPTHGVSEIRRLIDGEKVEAILGSVVSQETIPMVPLTTEAGLLQISASASTTLTPEYGPYHFSTSPTGLDQMKANVDFAVDNLGLTKLALISDNGGMSKAAVVEIIAYMEERGVAPVIVQEFPYKAEDMTPQLFSMRGADAEAVLIINSLGDDSRKFLENRLDIGWMVPVLGSMTMTNYAVGNAALLGEEAFEGVYSTVYVGMTYCPGDELWTTPFSAMAKLAQETVPDLERMGGASALVSPYTMAQILALAINGAGTADGATVAKWLEAQPSIDTVAGPFAATADKHFFPTADSLRTIINPHLVREDGLTMRATCEG
jgi:ABC-type branched-subunit amino acid transport system substrate-binding protein